MTAKVEIWATRGLPLRQSEWEKHGYSNLFEYIQSIIDSHDGHKKRGCHTCEQLNQLPLVTFGFFDPDTNERNVAMLCETEEDLPTESILNILEFNSN